MITFSAQSRIRISDNYLKKLENDELADFKTGDLARAVYFIENAAPLIGKNEDVFTLRDKDDKLYLSLNDNLPSYMGYEKQEVSPKRPDESIKTAFLYLCKKYFDRNVNLPSYIGNDAEENIEIIKSSNFD